MRNLRPRPASAGIACLLLALAAAGCGDARPADGKPNVLLVTVDTLRADRVGCYGRKEARTGTLDALAARGVRFDAAWTSVPLTLPAHATLLTGHHPPEHGLHVNGRAALGDEVPTLASRAKAAGRATAAFVSASVLDAAFGLDTGFDRYDDELGAIVVGGAPTIERPAARTVDAARAWIAEQHGPWFAWVHLYDPHMPWQAEEPWRSSVPDPYDAEIAAVDAQLARLFAAVDPATTLIVVTSDHGEGLGEHGEQTHGVLVHEATLRVPLVVAGPGAGSGLVARQPVGLVDVAPTIAALAGWQALGAGRDLAPALRGEALLDGPLYAESEYARLEFGWAPLHALRVGDDKLVDGPTRELYDLAADPRELDDRAARETQRAAGYAAALAELRTTMRPLATGGAKKDPALQQALQALGYAGGSGTVAAGGRDPRRSMAIIDLHAQGASLLQHGRGPDAVEPLRRAVEAAGESPVFRLDYARALAAAGRAQEARAQLAEALRLSPDLEQAHYHLAILQSQAGEYDAALRSYERSLQLAEGAWPSRVGRAWVLVRVGREGEAVDELSRVVAERPQERALRLDLARLLRGLGRAREALQQLDAAVAMDAADRGAKAWLAWELATNADDALRDGARSLALAQELVAADGRADAYQLEILAAALAEQGRPDEAARVQQEALQKAPADLDPALKQAWNERGALYARGGKHREP